MNPQNLDVTEVVQGETASNCELQKIQGPLIYRPQIGGLSLQRHTQKGPPINENNQIFCTQNCAYLWAGPVLPPALIRFSVGCRRCRSVSPLAMACFPTLVDILCNPVRVTTELRPWTAESDAQLSHEVRQSFVVATATGHSRGGVWAAGLPTEREHHELVQERESKLWKALLCCKTRTWHRRSFSWTPPIYVLAGEAFSW